RGRGAMGAAHGGTERRGGARSTLGAGSGGAVLEAASVPDRRRAKDLEAKRRLGVESAAGAPAPRGAEAEAADDPRVRSRPRARSLGPTLMAESAPDPAGFDSHEEEP